MSIPERWARFRKLPPDIRQKVNLLTPLFERERVKLVYLFGSLTHGEHGHDVDLAILTRGEPAFRLLGAIIECLGTERVDLVDLRQASPVLRFEIVRTGQLLYQVDETACEDFEMSTLRLYKDTVCLRDRQRYYLKEQFKQWSLNQTPLSKD